MFKKDLPDKTDEELVILAIESQNHFLYLVNRYENKLLNYILRISDINKEGAEDLLQEVFIKVYQNLNEFDNGLKFSSWIYRITRNQVISNFRKISARIQAINFDDNILENLASDLDIEKELERVYLKENVGNILNNIDEKYKEVLILRFLEEKDYKEISDILKKPMGTVATLLNRAKKELKNNIPYEQFK